MSVGHDGGDGKRKQIFGVLIFLVHPKTLEVYRIPVALAEPLGKNAQVLCDTTLLSLKRAGVEPEDIFRSVNDNFTTTIRTGNLYVFSLHLFY